MDGGRLAYGYDVKDKALLVDQNEANAIRTIFAENLAARSLWQLVVQLKELVVVRKYRNDRHRQVSSDKACSRGEVYNILRNLIYNGKVRQKEELYGLLHKGIIDDATWKMVKAQLAGHGAKKIDTVRRPAKRLLEGLLLNSKVRLVRTTYASKTERRGVCPLKSARSNTQKLCLVQKTKPKSGHC